MLNQVKSLTSALIIFGTLYSCSLTASSISEKEAYETFKQTELRQRLLDDNKYFAEFLTGPVTEVPSIFENSGQLDILVTSYEQADQIFDRMNMMLAFRNNHSRAMQGLETLILSMTEGALPYSEERFENYKRAFIFFATHSGHISFDVLGAREFDLYFAAGKIIEFMSEKQKDVQGAEQYALRLMQEAYNAIDADFFHTMVSIWLKFHDRKGTLSEGFNVIVDLMKSFAQTPNATLFSFSSPLPFDLVMPIEYVEKIGAPFIIQKCRETLDIMLSHTFDVIDSYPQEFLLDMLKYSMVTSALAETDFIDKQDEKNSYYKNEINRYQAMFKQGTRGIIALAKERLAGGIAKTALRVITLIQETHGTDAAEAFRQETVNKLVERGFSEYSTGKLA